MIGLKRGLEPGLPRTQVDHLQLPSWEGTPVPDWPSHGIAWLLCNCAQGAIFLQSQPHFAVLSASAHFQLQCSLSDSKRS